MELAKLELIKLWQDQQQKSLLLILSWMKKSIQERGFTVSQVAEKHGWTEPMVWSLYEKG